TLQGLHHHRDGRVRGRRMSIFVPRPRGRGVGRDRIGGTRWEEDAVPFLPDLGEEVQGYGDAVHAGDLGYAGREVARVRGEAESRRVFPRRGGGCLFSLNWAGEPFRRLLGGDPPRHGAAPDDVEGDGGREIPGLPGRPQGGEVALAARGVVVQ